MSKMADLDLRIEDILNTFDFNKVRGVMEFLGEDWEGALPSVEDLRIEARYILEKAIECEYVASGGFIARFDVGKLSLVYVIEEIDESYES